MSYAVAFLGGALVGALFALAAGRRGSWRLDHVWQVHIERQGRKPPSDSEGPS